MNILEVLEYPEIVLSLNHGRDSTLELQNVFLGEIRGTNYQEDYALIFTDSNECRWLWKKVSKTTLLNEFIVSFLAQELGISVPTSLIAKRGNSLGLLQKWMKDAVELSSYTNSQPNRINKEEIMDLVIFSAWIGANDRHASNHLYSDGRLYAIDFEDSFSVNINGNELCLYFPFIKYSNRKKESLFRIKSLIMKKKLLNKLENFGENISFKEDIRAKKALKDQLKRIHSFLSNNFNNLEVVVDNYIEISLSPADHIDLF